MTSASADALQPDLSQFDAIHQKLAQTRAAMGTVIFGQDETITAILAALAAGGHTLLVGAPGLAKTLLVSTLGTLLGLQSKRIQFTPDLMPSDILGAEVLEEAGDGRRQFRFIRGPIFCQLLMADEINRASPRTQSALLQAMQEYEVTIAGENHALPTPFHVLATQNPLEQEGTYPLPEAQLDRFLLQINIDYPDRDAERQMLAQPQSETPRLEAIMSEEEAQMAQRLVSRMPIGEQVINYILSLVRQARPTPDAPDFTQEMIAWGPGPRASQALSVTARALALVEGRTAPSIADVQKLAKPVLRHRMALQYGARAQGMSVDGFIEKLINETPID